MSRASRRGLPAPPAVSAPADRRFRRAEATPERRRRMTRTAWRFVRAGLPLLLVIGLGTVGAHWLMASDMFLVRQIAVQGNVRLSADEVETLVEGLRRENIFRVDFEKYRRRILDSPWVADVTMSRALPARITIGVVERTPMAVGRLGEQLYLVDVAGSIIDEYGAEYREFDLPVVDGLVTTAGGSTPVTDAHRVQLTGALLDGLDARPDLRRRVSQIDVSNAHDARVMFDDDPAWLHLGEADFAGRLTHYVEMRTTLLERFGALDYVDLRFGERIYVRGQGRRTGPGAAK